MDIFRKKEIIDAIYHEGGFSKAAKTLHIAQPSLSVMVANIEKEIGAKLFDRSTTPVRLTPIGEKYLECCDSITQIEEDFMTYINGLKGLDIGEMSLGGTTLYMSNIIPTILSVYSEKHPSIHVNLYDHDSPNLISMLQTGELDIAIDNLYNIGVNLTGHYLGTEFLLIAVPQFFELNNKLKEYAYTFQDIIDGLHVKNERPALRSFRPFKDSPFILLQEGFDTRRRCDAVFEDYGIRVRPSYELNQLSSALGMAASGLGITVVSDTLIKNSPDWGNKMLYYSARSEDFTRDVYYYTRKSRLLSRAIEEFIEISRLQNPLTLFKSELA